MNIKATFFIAALLLFGFISAFSLAYDDLPSIIKTELPGKIVVVFNGQLDLINPQAGTQQILSTNQTLTSINNPVWSPTTSYIVFEALHWTNSDTSFPSSDIFRLSSDGSDFVQLTQNMGMNNYPLWTPDGQKIIFKSKQDGISNIFSIDFDGTNLTKLTDFESADWDFWDLNLSPDGKQIVFVSDREYRVPQPDGSFFSKSTRVSIGMVDNGKIGRIEDITSGSDCGVGDFYRAPMWSPDGNYLALSFGCSQNTGEIYLFDSAEMKEDSSIEAAQKLMLAENKNQVINGFSWSPDGANIVFVNQTLLDDYSQNYDNLMVVSMKQILELEPILATSLTLNENPEFRYSSPSWK
ncbi:MAG: hypothetical protein ABI690_30345 [Chloroflexota bacterium]